MNLLIADLVWQPISGARWGPAISVAHFVAALLCWRVATATNRDTSVQKETDNRSVSRFWLTLAVIMFVFSMNKFFDLQSILTMYGRSIAKQGGWYRQRQTLQAVLVLGAIVVGLIGLLLSLRLLRGRWRERSLAYVSVVFLLTLIAVRAASYSPVDKVLYALPVIGNRMNAGLELAAAILVSLGAFWAARRLRRNDGERPFSDPESAE